MAATDLFHGGDPNAFLFLQWPDAARLQAQATAITVGLPKGVQHLLGIVDSIDHDLAAVRADKVTDEILYREP